jgi:hypothetical protein
MVLLFGALMRPTLTFRLLRTRSSWAGAAAVLAIVQIVLVLLPAFLGEARIPVPVVIAVGVTVLFWVFLKWILSAGVLHWFSLLIGADSPLRTFHDALVVIVYSSAIYSLELIVSAVLGVLRWVIGWADRFQFTPILSARTAFEMFPVEETFSLLGQVNIFSAWYLVVLTIAIARVYFFKVRTAVLLASSVWFFLLIVQTATRELLKASIVGYSF